MGAPALDPAAGCLPAAVSPGFFQREIFSCFAGAIALAAWFPLPSPSPRSFPQTKVSPCATTSSGPLRAGCPSPLWGRATAGPRVCGTALVDGGGGGGWAAAGYPRRRCQDLRWHRKCHSRKFKLVLAHPRVFVPCFLLKPNVKDLPSQPPWFGLCLRVASGTRETAAVRSSRSPFSGRTHSLLAPRLLPSSL